MSVPVLSPSDEHIATAADYVLGGEPDGTSRASTILSLAAGKAGTATVLRRGDLTAAEIEAATPVVGSAIR